MRGIEEGYAAQFVAQIGDGVEVENALAEERRVDVCESGNAGHDERERERKKAMESDGTAMTDGCGATRGTARGQDLSDRVWRPGSSARTTALDCIGRIWPSLRPARRHFADTVRPSRQTRDDCVGQIWPRPARSFDCERRATSTDGENSDRAANARDAGRAAVIQHYHFPSTTMQSSPLRRPPPCHDEDGVTIVDNPAKRARPSPTWADEAVEYIQGNLLRNLDLRCTICLDLKTDCAMLQSTCACKVVVCFQCHAAAVKQRAVKVNEWSAPPNVVTMAATALAATGLHTVGGRNSVSSCLSQCPSCRLPNISVVPMSGSHWLACRQLVHVITSSLEKKELVKASDKVHITCTVPEHRHDSDEDWLKCEESARFKIGCPANGCTAELSFHLRASLCKQLRSHLFSGECRGKVECPFCAIRVRRDVDGLPYWRCEVDIKHIEDHLRVHLRLRSLWEMFFQNAGDQSETARTTAWWTAVSTMVFASVSVQDRLEDVGGLTYVQQDRCPLSRILNKQIYNPEWVKPWMRNFMTAMSTKDGNNHNSFAYFFNAAFPAL